MRELFIGSCLLALSGIGHGCGGDSTSNDDAAPKDSGSVALADASLRDASGIDAVDFDASTGVPVDLDVLFVIDNSAGTGEEQAALVSAFPAFLTQLETRAGVLPNLHVGVISSDVGAGDLDSGGCSGEGDNGSLAASTANCALLSGSFVQDVNVSGTRMRNYSGSLSDILGCLATVGTTGCGFEQHLESLRRALNGSRPENDGFLRPNASLAVIVLANEDDCSAENEMILFDPDPAIEPFLGPLSSFRCTEYGVVCDGMAVSRTTATYATCSAATTFYLTNPIEFAIFLKGLKPDPTQIGVAVIVGADQPFAVTETAPNEAVLNPSCTTALGPAVPGVRLRDFQAEFGSRGLLRDLCSADIQADMTAVADFIVNEIL